MFSECIRVEADMCYEFTHPFVLALVQLAAFITGLVRPLRSFFVLRPFDACSMVLILDVQCRGCSFVVATLGVELNLFCMSVLSANHVLQSEEIKNNKNGPIYVF